MLKKAFTGMVLVTLFLSGVLCFSAGAPQVSLQTSCLNDSCTTYSLQIYPYLSSGGVKSIAKNLNRVILTIDNPETNTIPYRITESSTSSSGILVYPGGEVIEKYYRGIYYLFSTNTTSPTITVSEISRPSF